MRMTLFGSSPSLSSSPLFTQVGPNRPDPPGISSLRRPQTAPTASSKTAGPKIKNEEAHPRFITPNGKWVQDQLPVLVAESQAQALTATDKLSASLPGQYGENRPVRPVTSVYSYADISPIATTEYIREGDVSDPVSTIRLSSAVVVAAAGEGAPVLVSFVSPMCGVWRCLN
jgi:hypothetical protein